MKNCDFSKAKVGDKVWASREGWLTIRYIEYAKDISYPIKATNDAGYALSFTTEGKENTNDKYPTLFWNEFEIPNEAFIKQLPKLEVDTLVWVWNNDKKYKILRFFSHFDNGDIYTFIDGRDSSCKLNPVKWNNWELYEKGKSLIFLCQKQIIKFLS